MKMRELMDMIDAINVLKARIHNQELFLTRRTGDRYNERKVRIDTLKRELNDLLNEEIFLTKEN